MQMNLSPRGVHLRLRTFAVMASFSPCDTVFNLQMRFDQLPTELLVMIANQTDMITRGCVLKTNTRMQAIYGKLPHYKSVSRVEISRTEKENEYHSTIVIHDNSSVSVTHFTEYGPAFNSYFLIIGHIGELSFRDVDCADCRVSNIHLIFRTLKFISKISFDNCVFAYTGGLLTNIAGKIVTRSIEIICPTVVKDCVKKVLFDKFFGSFPGDFQFTVKEQKNFANLKTSLTNETLSGLMENPRKVFKLENVICDFTPYYLTIVVKAMLSNNWKVDWNFGVITIAIEEQTFFHNGIHHTLLGASLAVNANYATNSVVIRGVPCVKYIIANQYSQMKFTVQPITSANKRILRKRAYQP